MNDQPLTRHQRRELERQSRKHSNDAADRSKAARKVVMYIVVIVVIGSGIYALTKLGVSGPPKEDLSSYFKGTFAENKDANSREHIKPGDPHEPYKTNPPTSGPHYDQPLAMGMYDSQQPDEALVHNLEHGEIWISYHCPSGCPELVEQLKNVVKRHSLYVLEPRTENPKRIALAAWEYYDTFDEFDEKRIEAFFQKREDQGPEKIPASAHQRK